MGFVADGLTTALRNVVIDTLKKQAMAWAIKQAPWLFSKYLAWFTNPVVGFIMEKIVAWAVDETALGLSLAWIAYDIQYEVSTAEEATKKLKYIIEDPERYTTSQVKEMEEQFDKAFVDLIRIQLNRFPKLVLGQGP